MTSRSKWNKRNSTPVFAKTRTLRVETLETRALLSASPTASPAFEALRDALLRGEQIEGGSIDVDPAYPFSIDESDWTASAGYESLREQLERAVVDPVDPDRDPEEPDAPEDEGTASAGYESLREQLEGEGGGAGAGTDSEDDPSGATDGGRPSDAYAGMRDQIEDAQSPLDDEDDPGSRVPHDFVSTKDYAVVFSGGSPTKSAFDNYDQYYASIVDLYSTLTDAHSIAPQNVYILYADGDVTGTKVNRLNEYGEPDVSDMSFATDFGTTVLAATYDNLEWTMERIAAEMTEDSHLLFVTNDHGYGVEGDPYDDFDLLVGWGETISGEQVRDAVYQIEDGYVSLAFGQCFAGGILDEFFDPSTGEQIVDYLDANGVPSAYRGSAKFAGGAASNHYESSYVNVVSYRNYDGWFDALVRGLVYESSTVDLFEYAAANDPFADWGEYPSNGGTYKEGVEHPWYCGGDFDVFSAPIAFKTDVYEPNDSLSTATDLGTLEFGGNIDLTRLYAEPYGCDDWYRFELSDCAEDGDRVKIALNSAEVDARLYCEIAGDLEFVSNIRSSRGFEIYPSETGRSYYIQVQNASAGIRSIPYELHLSIDTDKISANPPRILSSSAGFDTISLSWSVVPQASSYVVAYRELGSELWKTVKTSDTSIALQNTYGDFEIRVRADSVLSHFHGSVYSTSVRQKTTGLPLVSISLSDEPMIGETLYAQIAPTDASATYQWYNIDPLFGMPTEIPGATEPFYTPASADLGQYIAVVATGADQYGGTVSVVSNDVVKLPLESVEIETRSFMVGAALTANVGPSDATVHYQWRYSYAPDDPGSWRNIRGANDSTYIATPDVVGAYLMVVATGTGDYCGVVSDVVGSAIEPFDLESIAVRGRFFSVGSRIETSLSPKGAAVEYQWFYCDESDVDDPALWIPIKGANESTYVPTAEVVGKRVIVAATGAGYYKGEYVWASTGTNVQPLAIGSLEITSDYVVVGMPVETALTPADATVEYQWYCALDDDPSNWIPIPGADEARFVPTADFIGTRLAVAASGTGDYYGNEFFAIAPEPVQALSLVSISLNADTFVVGTRIATKLNPSYATVVYEWFHKNDPNEVGYWIPIEGANSSSFVPTTDLAGEYIAVRARGTGDYAGKIVYAITSEPVQPRDLTAIYFNTDRFELGEEITTTLFPATSSATYQWFYRDEPAELGYWTPIDGATASSYTPTAEVVGSYVAVRAIGTGAYSDRVVYAISGERVQGLTFESISIDASEFCVGTEITTTKTPSEATVSYQWYYNAEPTEAGWTPIDGATSASYIPTSETIGRYVAVKATGTGAYRGTSYAAFADAPIKSIAVDSVAIATKDGEVGSEFEAVLTPASALATYQWYFNDKRTEDGWTAIDGATAARFVPTDDLIGRYLAVKATGLGAYQGNVAVAFAESPVKPRALDAISIESEDFRVGTEFKATHLPTNAPATYQWYFNDAPTQSGWTAIEGANGSRFVPSKELIGKYLAVKATGAGDYSGSSVVAFASSTVKPRAINAFEIVAPNFYVGTTFKAATAPTYATVSYQWYYNDAPTETGWTAIQGANEAEFVPTTDLVGRYLAVKAIGTGDYRGTTVVAFASSTVKARTVDSIAIVASESAVGVEWKTKLTPERANVAYQWYYNDAPTETGWIAIQGADEAKYTPTKELVGKYLAVKAIGIGDYEGSEASAVSAEPVSPRKLDSIAIVAANRFVGTEKLAVLAPENATVVYQWYYNDAPTEVGWTAIQGADEARYVPTKDVVGKYIAVKAIGIGDFEGNSVVAFSNSTVKARPIDSLSIDAPSRMIGTEFKSILEPTDATATWQWYYNDVPTEVGWTAIQGANEPTFAPTSALIGQYLAVKATGTGDYEGNSAVAFSSGPVKGRAIESVTIDVWSGYVGSEYRATTTPESADVSYQWYYNDAPTETGWIAIEGATFASYLPTPEVAGRYLAVKATGTGEYRGSSAVAFTSEPVRPNWLESVEIVAPSLTVGAVLRAVQTPSDVRAAYRWYRSSSDGWIPIEGATGRSYVATSDDAGSRLKVVATASTGGYGESVEATTSGPIVEPVPFAPSFKAETSAILDGAGTTLNVVSSDPIERWTIDWGDGQTTERVCLSDALSEGHVYARGTTERRYAITLSVVSPSGEGKDVVYDLAYVVVPALETRVVPSNVVRNAIELPNESPAPRVVPGARPSATLASMKRDRRASIFENAAEFDELDDFALTAIAGAISADF